MNWLVSLFGPSILSLVFKALDAWFAKYESSVQLEAEYQAFKLKMLSAGNDTIAQKDDYDQQQPVNPVVPVTKTDASYKESP